MSILKKIKVPCFSTFTSKEECFSSFDLNCFFILDPATIKYQTKLNIDWKKPNLNKQKKPSAYYFINLINFYGFPFFLFIFKLITITLIAFIIVYFV